jgi:Flp pilus assembly protein TadG
MMRKLDQRGVAALEFCLVAAPLFVLMFAIFDLGRYAITMQSLRTLASAGARATMIKCYTPAVLANNSPSGCTLIDTYLPDAQKQDAAPFLFSRDGTLRPTMSTTAGAAALTVTARQPGFTMLTPIIWSTWSTRFNAPSASASIPF